MTLLADRYHEIMRFRLEALTRYRANVLSTFTGPKARLCFPTIAFVSAWDTIQRVGPLFFKDRAPVASFVEAAIRGRSSPVTILEIGPGNGFLARSLREKFGPAIAAYYAFDRDASVAGPFVLVPSIEQLSDRIDIVIAAEVIEHMTADEFYSSILEPLRDKLADDACFAISTPNALAPGGIARDFTHVQRYPWYDLYAVVRLAFSEVDVFRIHYVFSYRRLLALLPRFVLCFLLELEWCDSLVCVARRPRSDV